MVVRWFVIFLPIAKFNDGCCYYRMNVYLQLSHSAMCGIVARIQKSELPGQSDDIMC